MYQSTGQNHPRGEVAHRLTFDLEESQPGKFKASRLDAWTPSLCRADGRQAKNVVGGTAERDQDSMMGKARKQHFFELFFALVV